MPVFEYNVDVVVFCGAKRVLTAIKFRHKTNVAGVHDPKQAKRVWKRIHRVRRRKGSRHDTSTTEGSHLYFPFRPKKLPACFAIFTHTSFPDDRCARPGYCVSQRRRWRVNDYRFCNFSEGTFIGRNRFERDRVLIENTNKQK